MRLTRHPGQPDEDPSVATDRQKSPWTQLVAGRPRLRTKLETVARLRGERPDDAAAQLVANLLRSVPATVEKYPAQLDELGIEASGFNAGSPWVRTRGGRTFHDHPASAKDVIMYLLFRDRLPAGLTPETLGVAANVFRRYSGVGASLPPGASVVVDAGAYVGIKAMGYADAMGPDGRVVAIEMMPDNYGLLRRNIEANDLGGRITPVHAALSDTPGTATARRHRKQAATIATDVDEFADYAEEGSVPMRTLAQVFDDVVGDKDVDFLNVQVNGHEVAVLGGLGPWADRVRAFSVTSPYSRDGQRLQSGVVEWFQQHGIPVTQVGETFVKAGEAPLA